MGGKRYEPKTLSFQRTLEEICLQSVVQKMIRLPNHVICCLFLTAFATE